MNKARTVLSFFWLILVAVIVTSVYFFWSVGAPVNKSGQSVMFFVEKGDSIKKISSRLEQNGLIRSKTVFDYYVKFFGSQNFIAGAYQISPAMSIEEIADVMTKGKVANNEQKITVIEGWNNNEIAKYLSANGFKGADFLATVTKPEKSLVSAYDFLKDLPRGASLEGYLFPDTYRISDKNKTNEIIYKMLDNFDKKLTPELRAEIKKQGKSIREIVTMASVIEKEVSKESDMKMVSGVFWNRIKNGQALQSCATLAYCLGVNKAQYSIEDTKVDSPYNTYQNKGLPIGPIANPGINAIKAAIYPTASNYNFFLSRPDTGETIFSKTLDEHNRNKAKYLR